MISGDSLRDLWSIDGAWLYAFEVGDDQVALRPSAVLAERRLEVLDLARARGGSNVRVFGHWHGVRTGPVSDVELLDDFPPHTSLLTVIGLERELRGLLGVPVDVGPADALRPDMRVRVLAEARPL